jgi:acid phosphatase type 7
VHIIQGDLTGNAVIVSWVTPTEPGSNTVLYGTSIDKLDMSAKGKCRQYKYYNYTSGFIHHATIKHLKV